VLVYVFFISHIGQRFDDSTQQRRETRIHEGVEDPPSQRPDVTTSHHANCESFLRSSSPHSRLTPAYSVPFSFCECIM
jgi:hypothetical protein